MLVKFLGIDLAWGNIGGSGVCVVENGSVLDSGVRHSQEEIIAWAAPHTASACLVAIDAPLVVINPDGQRPCETFLARCFGRYGAGPHSSNLGMASFANGIRGAQIAAALGLSIDPIFDDHQPVRAAIEVFPHPALVALFGLAESLKYKAKTGRPIVKRQEAFGRLIDCIESLKNRTPPMDVSSCLRWSTLRQVTSITNVVALDRLEDELDAFVCAYVGLYFWTYGLEKSRIVGDLKNGYIVTPVGQEQARCLDRRDVPIGAKRTPEDTF